MDAYWKQVSINIEKASGVTMEATKEEQRNLKGHGKPAIKLNRKAKVKTIIIEDDDTYIGNIDHETARLRMQSRRCTMIASAYKQSMARSQPSCRSKTPESL